MCISNALAPSCYGNIQTVRETRSGRGRLYIHLIYISGSLATISTHYVYVIDRPQGSCGVWDIPKVLRGEAE